MTKDEVIESIKADEGYSETVYFDSKGIPTVGWGHAFLGTEVPKVGAKFTRQQCEEWLERDIDIAYADYQKFGLKDVHPIAAGVIVQMLFNMGFRRFSGFKQFLKYIRVADYKAAALEMLDSKWHREDVGKRAVRLAWQVFKIDY